MKTKMALLLIFSFLAQLGHTQGFVNLDFEGANISGASPNHYISAADAFPGWTVSAGYILYDDISLSGGSISIVDANPLISYLPPQGNYFAFLFAANDPQNLYSISLGQTGTVPVSARSITFWGTLGGMQATFNGQPLDFLVTGNTANYNIYTADISTFAEQEGQLLFTLPANVGYSALDNIQFSSSPIPEPSTFA
ncbi:MAG: hypothetical protein WCS94_20835, partial [Verrucomicrobiota bacterium]